MIRPAYSSLLSQRRSRSGQSVVEFALVAPLLVILLFAIVDFARIYTTVMSVESSAREAADFGTTLGAAKWQAGSARDTTVAEMQKRTCTASSNLPEYVDPDDDPGTGCENPSFAYCVTPDDGDPATTETCGPINDLDGCQDPLRVTPCKVTVTITYDFRLLAPLNVEFLGVTVGLPSTITLGRDSTFAMTDIEIAPGP
jgi:Flp pilus assembly protein TadG